MMITSLSKELKTDGRWKEIAPMSAAEIQLALQHESNLSEVARRIGTTRQMMSYYANGDKVPGMRMAVVISEYYRENLS